MAQVHHDESTAAALRVEDPGGDAGPGEKPKEAVGQKCRSRASSSRAPPAQPAGVAAELPVPAAPVSPMAPAGPAGIDWDSYNAHIRWEGRCADVLDDRGKVVGQIQPKGGVTDAVGLRGPLQGPGPRHMQPDADLEDGVGAP